MGQRLFFPPSVAGWPGGLAWLGGQELVARANFAAWITEPSSPGDGRPFRRSRQAIRPQDARKLARRPGDVVARLAAVRGRPIASASADPPNHPQITRQLLSLPEAQVG